MKQLTPKKLQFSVYLIQNQCQYSSVQNNFELKAACKIEGLSFINDFKCKEIIVKH